MKDKSLESQRARKLFLTIKNKPLPTLGPVLRLWCLCLKDFQRAPHLGATTQYSSPGAQRPFSASKFLYLCWPWLGCLGLALPSFRPLSICPNNLMAYTGRVTYLWLFGSLGEELEANRLAFRVRSQTNSLGLCIKAEAVCSRHPGLHWSPAVTQMPMYAKFTKGAVPTGSPCFLVGDRMDMTLSRQEATWQRLALEGRGGGVTRCLKFLMEGRASVLEETEGREGSINGRRTCISSHHVQAVQNQDPGS